MSDEFSEPNEEAGEPDEGQAPADSGGEPAPDEMDEALADLLNAEAAQPAEGPEGGQPSEFPSAE